MSGSLPEQFKKQKKKITQLQKENGNLILTLKAKDQLIVKQDFLIGELNLKILEAKI